MKILLTNDDGPFSEGLCLLRQALEELGEVAVVCPAEERSGVGHAITYLAPVRAAPVTLADGGPAWTVTGTPADCVKFAMLELLDGRPDLVVSGPNLGINAGVDVFYSGTVAAAIEGGFYGVNAVAVSTSRRNEDAMQQVAAQTVRVLRLLLGSGAPSPAVYSINIPHLCAGEPEVRFTRQSTAFPPGHFARLTGPRGRTFFFLDSTTGAGSAPADSDVAAVEAGAIAVTPLRVTMTDEAALDRLRADVSSRLTTTYGLSKEG